MKNEQLKDLALEALEDLKAVNVVVLDVRKISTITDFMIIASGNSDRHVKSLADKVVEKAKAAGVRPLGVEGERVGDWILVDLVDVVVHVMKPDAREFYSLERLWTIKEPNTSGASSSS